MSQLGAGTAFLAYLGVARLWQCLQGQKLLPSMYNFQREEQALALIRIPKAATGMSSL